MSNQMPNRAPLRLPSNSNVEPPLPKEPATLYSDRFKKAQTPAPQTKVPDLSSTKEFPSLFKSAIVQPNMVIMPKVSFADKVKQMAEAEEQAKKRAEQETLLRLERERHEAFANEQFSGFRPHAVATATDTWSTREEEELEYPGTPEFGREGFLHEEEENEDGWT